MFKPTSDIYKKLKWLGSYTIVVEGTIGSGKTTLCKWLARVLNENGLKTKLFLEPVNIDFLNMFISDPKKYSFPFQVYQQQKRINIYDRAQKACEEGFIAIIDRSIDGDMIFEKNHHTNGFIDDKEHKIYMEEYKTVLSELLEPELILRLDVTLETSKKRIKKRSRKGECGYTDDYLTYLIKEHKKIKATKVLIWDTAELMEDKEILDILI